VNLNFSPLLLALLLAACSKSAPVTEDVRPVRAITVAPSAATAVAELAGEVRPRVESRVGFRVAERITARNVDVGQIVKAGQPLATLDASDYKVGAAVAGALLAGAEVERNQQRADYKRFQDLHKQGFISAADLERLWSAIIRSVRSGLPSVRVAMA
jgi:membrane fusion protein, multidrug efflux system